MPDRRWITREEIAEIHDAIAEKIAFDPANENDEGYAHYASHVKSAETLRETEAIGVSFAHKRGYW